MEFEFLDPEPILVVTGEGPGSVQNCVALLDAVVRHPRFVPGLAIAYDFGRMRPARVTRADISAGVEAARRDYNLSDAPIALIAPSHLGYGLLRMLEGLARHRLHRDARAFRSRDAALEWLRAHAHVRSADLTPPH